MSIRRICCRDVICVPREADVRTAARLMRDHHVGTLVVVDELDGRRSPVGMVTDRDVTIAVVALGLDPGVIQAGDIMNAELVTVPENTGAAEAGEIMRKHGLRRVVVTDAAGSLAGIVTADDILTLLAGEMSDLSALVAHGPNGSVGFRKAAA